MFVSIATTHRPATDLGFLLMKHPERAHVFDLNFGKAHVFFPEANAERCEAALALEVDTVGLVRGRGAAKACWTAMSTTGPMRPRPFFRWR